MEGSYAIASAMMFWVLFSIWKTTVYLNLVLKFTFLVLALVGSLVSLQYLGFVVRP
jgi:hypothetical protein